MKKILVVFAKEHDFENLQFDKTIRKLYCQNSATLFVNNYINYRIWERENDYILITVKFEDTIFKKRKIKNIHETLGMAIKSFVGCIVTPERISENFEYIVIVHEVELCPNERFKITSYSIGGEGAPKKRGDILKEIFSQSILLKEGYEKIKKNFITEEDKKRGALFTFSILKHRIAHLFLPLDIDLQGISEVKERIKEVYLKEVLQEKNGNGKPKDKNGNPAYYRQKLADLWYMVVKKDFGVQKINGCEIVTPRSSAELLVGDKAIIDLIKESGKQDKVKNLWEILLNLCGIKYDSDSFDKTNYSVINSPIFGFMCLMDKKIGKDKIEKGDVEEILNYFSKLNDNKGWEVKGANPEIINSFHDWFCALMDCLDKIREKLR